MAQKIFLQIDGKPKGPFSLSQIKQLAASGKISAETLGSPEVDGQPSQQWRKIGLIKNLFGEAQPRPQSVSSPSKPGSSAKPKAPPPPKGPSPLTAVGEDVSRLGRPRKSRVTAQASAPPDKKPVNYLVIGSLAGVGLIALCAILFVIWYSGAKEKERIAKANAKVEEAVRLTEEFLKGGSNSDLETVEKRLAKALKSPKATNLKIARDAEKN